MTHLTPETASLGRPAIDEMLLDELDSCTETELYDAARRMVIALLDVAVPRENSVSRPEKIARRALVSVWYDLDLGMLPESLRKIHIVKGVHR